MSPAASNENSPETQEVVAACFRRIVTKVLSEADYDIHNVEFSLRDGEFSLRDSNGSRQATLEDPRLHELVADLALWKARRTRVEEEALFFRSKVHGNWSVDAPSFIVNAIVDTARILRTPFVVLQETYLPNSRQAALALTDCEYDVKQSRQDAKRALTTHLKHIAYYGLNVRRGNPDSLDLLLATERQTPSLARQGYIPSVPLVVTQSAACRAAATMALAHLEEFGAGGSSLVFDLVAAGSDAERAARREWTCPSFARALRAADNLATAVALQNRLRGTDESIPGCNRTTATGTTVSGLELLFDLARDGAQSVVTKESVAAPFFGAHQVPLDDGTDSRTIIGMNCEGQRRALRRAGVPESGGAARGGPDLDEELKSRMTDYDILSYVAEVLRADRTRAQNPERDGSPSP